MSNDEVVDADKVIHAMLSACDDLVASLNDHRRSYILHNMGPVADVLEALGYEFMRVAKEHNDQQRRTIQ